MSNSDMTLGNYIKVNVESTNQEPLELTLSAVDVAKYYSTNKRLNEEVVELKRRIEREENSAKYAREARETLQHEINDAHTLLTALGIPEKDAKAESYASPYQLSIRLALYIAGLKGIK